MVSFAAGSASVAHQAQKPILRGWLLRFRNSLLLAAIMPGIMKSSRVASPRLRDWPFKLAYGTALFVLGLSALETFSQINNDLFHFPAWKVHLVVALLALTVALWEVKTRKGLDGLKAYFQSADTIGEPPPRGEYRFRRADPGDISGIHDLAARTYGPTYKFPESRLREWWTTNRDCFVLMLCDGVLVGYMDAFPISPSEYAHLLAGKDEAQVMPLARRCVDSDSSFYIASIVVEPEHRGSVLRFINAAGRFYRRTYGRRRWRRVCAMAFSPDGAAWIMQRGMSQAKGSDIWYIDDQTWPDLSKQNQKFWQPLFG